MSQDETGLVSSGIAGLDEILGGGLPEGRPYLVQGLSGSGKTTLGLQFALAGAEAGEKALYISLAETEFDIHGIAASHGWDLGGLEIRYQGSVGPDPGERQTVLHPAEIELPSSVSSLLEVVAEIRPKRLVIDSLSELRALAREPRWFRQELMRLRIQLESVGCTALLLDTAVDQSGLKSLFGGVIRLERRTPDYGPDQRRLSIVKIRGHAYETGYHDLRIRRGGLSVFPRLIAAQHRQGIIPGTQSTGLPALDAMLGGDGLDRGTAVLLLGPTGVGKSTLALQMASAAASRGENVLAYVFDERLSTVFQRARQIGIDLERPVSSGRITLRQVDPVELTPGEFADEVRRSAIEKGVQLVLIDTLNAYLYAMPNDSLLTLHLHELLAYLSQQGVTSIMVGTQHGFSGAGSSPNELDVSYLADTVVLLRNMEIEGWLSKTLTVFKRRAGSHETSVRALQFGPDGISIGRVVSQDGLYTASSVRANESRSESPDPRSDGDGS